MGSVYTCWGRDRARPRRESRLGGFCADLHGGGGGHAGAAGGSSSSEGRWIENGVHALAVVCGGEKGWVPAMFGLKGGKVDTRPLIRLGSGAGALQVSPRSFIQYQKHMTMQTSSTRQTASKAVGWTGSTLASFSGPRCPRRTRRRDNRRPRNRAAHSTTRRGAD